MTAIATPGRITLRNALAMLVATVTVATAADDLESGRNEETDSTRVAITALTALAAGQDPAIVAEQAGCPDVVALEGWLMPPYQRDNEFEFALIEAGAGGSATELERRLRTPLAAERKGMRPRSLFMAGWLPPTLWSFSSVLLPNDALQSPGGSAGFHDPWRSPFARPDYCLGPFSGSDPRCSSGSGSALRVRREQRDPGRPAAAAPVLVPVRPLPVRDRMMVREPADAGAPIRSR